ncbi:F-box only protein 39-like [Styela clava]
MIQFEEEDGPVPPKKPKLKTIESNSEKLKLDSSKSATSAKTRRNSNNFDIGSLMSDGTGKTLSKSMTSIDDLSNEDNPHGWATVPHVILEHIFVHLAERHRPSAMYVCKRWYTVMRHTGNLWRVKSFRFSGRDPRDSTHLPYRNATQYVRIFGKYLRRLEFRLYNPALSSVCRKFQRAIRVCFITLIKEKARLEELSIPGLQLDRGQWNSIQEDFTTWLAKYFCKGQHTLERVNLRSAKMCLNDGYKVLFSLGYEMGDTVTYLDLEDFFFNRRPIFLFTEFVDCMRQFKNLRDLFINYSYISEDFLETLAEHISHDSLKRLHIKVHAYDPHYQIIQGQFWSALRNKCPNCKVDMKFERVMSSEEHFRILCPQIPLRQITFDGCYFAEQDWQIGPTISTILPHYSNTLEKITLDLPDTYEVFDSQFLALIEHCKSLYYLKINAFISTKFIEKLVILRENDKCSVDTLKVRIYVRDFDTVAEERDLERIYNAHKLAIRDKFYDYSVGCCVSLQ